jgi:hypothetical protein
VPKARSALEPTWEIGASFVEQAVDQERPELAREIFEAERGPVHLPTEILHAPGPERRFRRKSLVTDPDPRLAALAPRGEKPETPLRETDRVTDVDDTREDLPPRPGLSLLFRRDLTPGDESRREGRAIRRAAHAAGRSAGETRAFRTRSSKML